ncbi:MAG: ABC transporter ATP-binding protein [Elusimicrobiales bacterium]|nr:ABC transporter ATP-binding protein [Elusimicrobiales bacterium]
MNSILSIKDLVINLKYGESKYKVIDSISIEALKGKITAVVGESGSGKTITFLSVVKLLPDSMCIESGEIIFDSIKILDLSERDLTKIRGKDICYIFQEPMTALDPVFTIESQMVEILLHHNLADYAKAKELSLKVLSEVGINPAKINNYPHNFSGGQRQRILIAMALLTIPKLIIADEPTTSLDVVTQLEILELIKKLSHEKNLSVILISHNISVVYNYSEYVYVMYLGQIVEEGETSCVIENPQHPYTEALLSSVVKLGFKRQIKPIEGIPPEINKWPNGCRFYGRCPYGQDKCKLKPPKKIRKGGYYYCWIK